jgi:hypothetical protein
MSDSTKGFMLLLVIAVLLIISAGMGNSLGRKQGRCAVVCDDMSNVAVCESGITVCKSGKVRWRQEGQY